MTALKDLQKNFKQHLVAGNLEILPDIISTEALSNIDRLAIYGNAYFARLIEVLESDFEAIHTLLGDDEFEKLSRRYIDTYPSRFFSLRWFGKYMEDFLRNTEPYSAHEYLHEMAKFEWLFTDAFDAKDIDIITEAEVAAISAEGWPHLKIKLHPSVCWFRYHWNILPVWKAIKDNEEVPVLQKLNDPETCLIWREGLTTKYRTLESTESLLLDAVTDGNNFSQWCELLIENGYPADEVPMIAAGALKTWLNLQMISGLEY